MCNNKASYRFTWPGRDEAFICNKCVPKLIAIAKAMGFPLHIIELAEEPSGSYAKGEILCSQKEG